MRQPVYITKNYNCPFENFTFPGEIFVRISDKLPEANFSPYLFISNYGRVYSSYCNSIITSITSYYHDGNINKYATITNLDGRIFPFHRVVLSCFGENNLFNKSLFIDHIDEIKNRNVVNLFNKDKTNLEWVTPSENVRRAQHGEKNCSNKITEETVIKVADLIMENKYSDYEIADMLADQYVTPYIVSNIRNKANWNYLTENYNFPKRKIQKLFSEEEVHMFCKYFEETKEKYKNTMRLTVCEETLRHFNYPVDDSHMNSIKLILRKTMYKHITSQYNY